MGWICTLGYMMSVRPIRVTTPIRVATYHSPQIFSDFSLTFLQLTDKKNHLILYFNGAKCITSNLGVTLKGKNLLPKEQILSIKHSPQ